MFEAVLAALADHGFTPTAIVTRLTYLSAPDSVQGALAAGLLGGGSRFLGVTEDCGRFLHDVLAAVEASCPTDDAGWDALALQTVQRAAGGRAVRPGPRAPRAQAGRPAHAAADADRPRGGPASARTWSCSRRSAGCTRRCSGRTLPLNGAGVCGAALADLGLPLELLRGFALLARTAGLIGQLAEELRHPVANDDLPVGRPEQPVRPARPVPAATEEDRMAELVAVIASTHHPFYYQASTRHRRGPAAVRRRVGAQDRGVPRDADQGPPRTCW